MQLRNLDSEPDEDVLPCRRRLDLHYLKPGSARICISLRVENFQSFMAFHEVTL